MSFLFLFAPTGRYLIFDNILLAFFSINIFLVFKFDIFNVQNKNNIPKTPVFF